MRLFIAVDLPPTVRDALRRQEDDLRRELPGLRWVRPEAIHLTLRFLGEVDETARPPLSAALAAALPGSQPAFRVGVGGLGTFPSRGRPQVIWVGLVEMEAGTLTRLQARVEAAVQEAGFPPEERPFRPHLTIARAGGQRPPAGLVERLAGRERPGPLSFEVSSVCLFRSILRPEGAEYRRLEEHRL